MCLFRIERARRAQWQAGSLYLWERRSRRETLSVALTLSPRERGSHIDCAAPAL